MKSRYRTKVVAYAKISQCLIVYPTIIKLETKKLLLKVKVEALSNSVWPVKNYLESGYTGDDFQCALKTVIASAYCINIPRIIKFHHEKKYFKAVAKAKADNKRKRYYKRTHVKRRPVNIGEAT